MIKEESMPELVTSASSKSAVSPPVPLARPTNSNGIAWSGPDYSAFLSR